MPKVVKPVMFEAGTLLLLLSVGLLGVFFDRFFGLHLATGWLPDLAGLLSLIA